jgi:hypothetical protein
MSVGDLQVSPEEHVADRTTADREEVDDLDEQARASTARALDGLDQCRQAGQEAVVANT